MRQLRIRILRFFVPKDTLLLYKIQKRMQCINRGCVFTTDVTLQINAASKQLEETRVKSERRNFIWLYCNEVSRVDSVILVNHDIP